MLVTTGTREFLTLVAGRHHRNGPLHGASDDRSIMNDPFKLQTIVHWTMGNLHNAAWSKVRSSILPITAGAVALICMRWRMNVLALGDEETRAVGLNPEREKLLVLVPSVLVASAAVAVAGIIGLVGLAVPHMAAPDHSAGRAPLASGPV